MKSVAARTLQEKADATIAKLKVVRQAESSQFDIVVSILADHAYAMGQPDLCFELQSMLLGKPSPNQS